MFSFNLKNIGDLPQKLQIGIAVIACISFFYIGYAWEVSALKKRLEIEKAQEKDLKSQFQFLFESQEEMNSDIAQLPKLQEHLKTWQSKFIKPGGLDDLLNEILKMGTVNDLHFDLFSPGTEMQEGSYIKVPIKAVVRGSYHDIANFISQIANMPTIVVISDFTISRYPSSEEKNSNASTDTIEILKGDLLLEVYYLPEKKL
jgi:type IV pilus assembly protein PilO